MTDPFVQKMLDASAHLVPGDPYHPLPVDRQTISELAIDETFVFDRTHFNEGLGLKFFKSVIPEMDILRGRWEGGNVLSVGRGTELVREKGSVVSAGGGLSTSYGSRETLSSVATGGQVIPQIYPDHVHHHVPALRPLLPLQDLGERDLIQQRRMPLLSAGLGDETAGRTSSPLQDLGETLSNNGECCPFCQQDSGTKPQVGRPRTTVWGRNLWWGEGSGEQRG